MTSSNLSAAHRFARDLRRGALASVVVVLAYSLLVFGPTTALSEASELACAEPCLASDGVVVVRCDVMGGPRGVVWRAWFEGAERACGRLTALETEPTERGVQCGEVGGAVWFWQRLEAPGRGSLRYRSWARGGAWRVEGAAIMPERLVAGASVVTEGRWGSAAPMPYGAFRDSVWLGGRVTSTAEREVTTTAEARAAGFASTVTEELQRLRNVGEGESVRDVQLLASARDDYASGRSGPGWLVLEIGEGAQVERVREVVRHEVAHQLIGGAIRLLRGGRDVGWFLEGFAEYLGFAMDREDAAGRSAFFRRFGEACEAASRPEGQVSDYDLGFLYASAVDGALWRSTATGLAERLESLLAGHRGPLVFGGREDFLGTEPRADFLTALLAGAVDVGAGRVRGWLEREEHPDLQLLASDLGVVTAKEWIPTIALPLSMHERRDGLFEVTSVLQASDVGSMGIVEGDLVWPLAGWSVARAVEVEVSRTSGWQRLTLATRPAMRERWRVVSVAGSQRRWFGWSAARVKPRGL